MLFKKGHYRASVLVQGTRHKLTMTHPSQSPVGLWEARCLDYNGTTYRAYAKAATKAGADRALQAKLGLIAPTPEPSKPRAKLPCVMHVPASTFKGTEYPARTFVYGLQDVCQYMADVRAENPGDQDFPGTVVFTPFQPAKEWKPGRWNKAKQAKWALSPEALQDFWSLVHGDCKGQVLKIIDKTQGSGQPLEITV